MFKRNPVELNETLPAIYAFRYGQGGHESNYVLNRGPVSVGGILLNPGDTIIDKNTGDSGGYIGTVPHGDHSPEIIIGLDAKFFVVTKEDFLKHFNFRSRPD